MHAVDTLKRCQPTAVPNPRDGWATQHPCDGPRLTCVRAAAAHDLRKPPNVLTQRLPGALCAVEVGLRLDARSRGHGPGWLCSGTCTAGLGLSGGRRDVPARAPVRRADADHEKALSRNSAFAGDGNGYKLGGDGEVVAHVVNNSAAWGNAGNGFTENSNTGAIVINRTTAYANGKWGYYFATSAARLGKNLAVSNGSGRVTKGSSVVSAGNNWDSGISTPSFVSTDASSTYNSRKPDGSLPSTTFLTTGSTTIGATMN